VEPFDPFTSEAIEDPYPQYHRLRARDPVHWSEKLRAWVLFRHDDVCGFFRDDRRLSSDRSKAARFKHRHGADAGRAVLRTVASDPPEHTTVRAILNAALGPRVRALAPRIDAFVEPLLDRIDDRAESGAERVGSAPEVDLVDELAHPLPINVIAELLDVPPGDRQRFAESSRAIAHGMDRFFSGGEARRGLEEIGAYFIELLGQRRGGREGDFLHDLLATDHHGERLKDLEAVAMGSALVFGGHETTANLLGNGILALLRHPRQLDRLRREEVPIETAVEELLRYDTPPQLISRAAAVDFELRGKEIRAGDTVLACLGAANRDPEVFSDPDRLDLGRSENPHVGFGLGTHFCPGAQLSRIEVRAALPALFRRFPNLRLGDTGPTRRRTVVLRGLEHLQVRVR
jgi:cytochrome P450